MTIQQFSHNDVEISRVINKYQGFFKVDEYQLRHRLFNGGYSKNLSREIFERGDAVVLIPYDPVKDNVIIIEQFRQGALRHHGTPWLLEFIAGMFDENESPVEVAIREAHEEANLTIEQNDILEVMTYFSSPGGTSECIHLYAANVDSTHSGGVHGLPEEGEDILVHVMTREEAVALLAQGKITNAATIIGLQWLQLNYLHLQSLWLNQ